MRTRKSERGSALVLAIVVTLVVAGMSGTYLTLSVSKKNAAFQEVEREKAFYAAEAALAQAKFELSSGRDLDTPGLGNVTLNGLANTAVSVTFDQNGLTGNRRRLTAIATFGPANRRTDRSIEEVVDKPIINPDTGAKVAIISNQYVDMGGNTDADGNDWDINGTSIVATGGEGIWSGEDVTITGSAGVGGNGLLPPASGAAPGSVDAHHDWETDGIDNDHDGVIDQPGEDFPATPDQLIGVPEGTLAMNAKKQGTYFTSQVAYTAALAANGGRALEGKIIYLDFIPAPPLELGTTMNVQPSLMVIHNAAGTAVAKNIHGQFKGLLIADKIEHVNSGTSILGQVYAWGQYGNMFGNGNSTIRYSSAALKGIVLELTPNYIRNSFTEVVR